MAVSTVDMILQDKDTEPFGVMEALQDIQEEFGYLPEDALHQVSEALNVPLIEVFRLANFYKAFTLEPRGRHLITVCMGTACHVQGAPKLADDILGQLSVAPGETTKDGLFTVETVNCLGACALAPVVIVDGQYYDHMTPLKLRKLIADIRASDLIEEGAKDGAA